MYVYTTNGDQKMPTAKINMAKVKNRNSIPKQAFLEAIAKAGNCNRLAVLMRRENDIIYKWLYKKCLPGKDLMRHDSAYDVQEAVNIKGLAERLCPSIKKIKEY